MENVSQPATGGSKTGMWVALIIAITVLGVGAYFLFARENGTNANNGNVLGNENANAVANQNVNTSANANLSTNANLSANTNASSIETKDYSGDLGISFQYPSDWRVIDLGDSKAGIALRPSDFTEFSLNGANASGSVYIRTISNPQDLSIPELLDSFDDSSRFWYESYSNYTATIADVSALRFDPFMEQNTSFTREEVFIPLDGQVISISHVYTNTSYASEFASILDSVKIPQ